MEKVLYITANPKEESMSYGLSVGREFINAYKQNNPQDEVTEIDLYKTDLPFIDEDVFSGWGKLQKGNEFTNLSANEQQKVRRINELTDQFSSVDKYVIVTPLWNLTIPPKMKAYIDTICIAGKTFKYTESGPVGLLTDKKALHIQARGGIYSEGPAKELELGDRYIHTILAFLGVKNVKTLFIEGMDLFPDKAQEITSKALMEAKELASQF